MRRRPENSATRRSSSRHSKRSAGTGKMESVSPTLAPGTRASRMSLTAISSPPASERVILAVTDMWGTMGLAIPRGVRTWVSAVRSSRTLVYEDLHGLASAYMGLLTGGGAGNLGSAFVTYSLLIGIWPVPCLLACRQDRHLGLGGAAAPGHRPVSVGWNACADGGAGVGRGSPQA